MGTKSHSARMVWYWPTLVMAACFLFGGLVGSVCAAFAVEESAGQIGLYLNEYMDLVQTGEVMWSLPFASWHHGRWFLGCALLGLTGLGVVLLPLLFGLRAFLLAFGIGCFIRFLGKGGLLLAICLFGLPALFWVPALIMVGSRLLIFSANRLRRNKGDQPLIGDVRHARRSAAVGFILLCVCVAFECNVLPVLLPLAVQILG